ncbi:oxidoreductase domain-containing protein [Deinococcus aerius]|uniref:Oxidoreductase domain-containing protein n=1 Tax=Deinococcus aerius TaxID=200253 RepID=A0A2I9DXE0_9DEIO|nr:hypothetical protein [Deinococcus aerius]GBF05365.1 oxidoreductase domain-containing protein [Deinococcus aerius]
MGAPEPASRITERIERETGVPGLAALLAERLAPADLTSLLLEVARRRAAARTPAQVLAQYEGDRFVRPSGVAPARLLDWERVALTSLPAEFEAVALSPVCPLGTSSVVAGVHQDWAVTTSRGTEVVSDATNVLALEAASRRKRLLRQSPRSAQAVHLAASHRLLRPQFSGDPTRSAHFSLFALVSAGRAGSGSTFELGALDTHLRVHLTALCAFLGSEVPLRVTVSDFSGRDRRREAESILASLRASFGGVTAQPDPERTHGQGYYTGLCFHLYGRANEQEYFLADGGEVDWTQRLLGNAKERLVVSGLGSERVCAVWGDG